MLHLFKTIYLEHDLFIEGGDYGHFSKLFENITMEEMPPNVLFYAANLNHAMPGATYSDFFRMLSEKDKRIVIYADDENYAEIMATWLKSTTNMNKEYYTKYVDMYLHKYDTFYGYPKQNLRTVLLNAWDTSTACDLTDVSKSVSYEFLLASALYNRDFEYKDIFKKTLLNFTKREYEYTFLELKKNLDNHMFSDAILKIFGEDIDDVEEMKQSEKYVSIFNRPMWKNEVSYDYVGINYLPGKKSIIDMSLATPEDIRNLFNLYVDFNTRILDNNSQLPQEVLDTNFYETDVLELCDAILSNHMSDELYYKCLDRIMGNSFIIGVPTDLVQNVLNIFVSYVKKLKLNNEMDKLYYFTLK